MRKRVWVRSCACEEMLEIPPQKLPRRPLDLLLGHFPAAFGEVVELVRHHLADHLLTMIPFVQKLIHHPCVAVLRRKASAQHFHPHPRDLLDDRWVVHEPPAAEEEQIWELARG